MLSSTNSKPQEEFNSVAYLQTLQVFNLLDVVTGTSQGSVIEQTAEKKYKHSTQIHVL